MTMVVVQGTEGTTSMDDEIRLLLWSLGWLRRNLARLGAGVTAVAMAMVAWFVLDVLSVRGSAITLGVLGLASILGLLLGMRWYLPDEDLRPTFADWLVAVMGAVAIGFLGFCVIIFFALFGSLVGFYAMALAAAVYLVLSLLATERRKRALEYRA